MKKALVVRCLSPAIPSSFLLDVPFYPINPDPVPFDKRNWVWVFFFSEKISKNFYIFKTSGSFLSSRRCKGGEEHRMKSIYQLFESFMEQEQLDPITANRLLKKILFMLRNKSKSDDPTRRNQK